MAAKAVRRTGPKKPVATSGARTVDAYIATFPIDVQRVLRQVRAAIRAVAPDAEETISYQMPAFVSGKNRVYFGGFKNHVGMYPPVDDSAPFKKDLARYEGPKGNLKFPLDEPLPLPLMRKVVRFQLKMRGSGKRGGG
jgi:uncharacterized protein YdhG (YjbR/CyaY superfamily)